MNHTRTGQPWILNQMKTIIPKKTERVSENAESWNKKIPRLIRKKTILFKTENVVGLRK